MPEALFLPLARLYFVLFDNYSLFAAAYADIQRGADFFRQNTADRMYVTI